MQVAQVYAGLSSAERLKVGCIIVKENRIISIGYNGMPSGWDNTCEVDNVTKPEVLHAETNAIAKVARSNESCVGATLFVTTAPCLDCAKLIYQSGISRVVWKTPHLRTDEGLQFLEKCDMKVERIEDENP
jgi:dCMP deaminase